MKNKGFQTRAIHVGNDPDQATGSGGPGKFQNATLSSSKNQMWLLILGSGALALRAAGPDPSEGCQISENPE